VTDPWTDADDGILGAAWEEGLTDAAIVALLPDRTVTAVRKRRQRLGLAGTAREIDLDRLHALHAEGLDTADIARQLGCTLRTCQELMSRERLRSHTRRGPKPGIVAG